MNGHDSIILAAGSNVVTSALDLFSQFAIIGGGLWATTILIYSTSYEPLRFRDIENRTSKSSDMNYSSPTIGVRFRLGLISQKI